MSPTLELLLLAAAGLVAGAVNAVAAGGSFLTLPILLFLGLPAGVANGTNRVGVLAQNLTGVWGFHRHGAVDWPFAVTSSIPAVLGAGLGALLALRVPDFAFTRLLSFAMVAMTLWSIYRARRWASAGSTAGTAATAGPARTGGPAAFAGFFVAGVYGGFIQAGVGFFLLAMTSAAGLNLIRGNAVKIFSVLLMTTLSLAMFAGAGSVDWPRGAALAAGNVAGGLVGVRVAVIKGHHWLERVVTATVIFFALLLWAS